MIVIVDSDGFIGNLVPQDLHHQETQRIVQTLLKKEAKLIYPATTIVETVTFLQGRLNSPKLAEEVIRLIEENYLFVEPVTLETLQEASSFIDFKRSKHDTLFDAIVAAIAKKYHADVIFSFDKFYKSKGFKLASEL